MLSWLSTSGTPRSLNGPDGSCRARQRGRQSGTGTGAPGRTQVGIVQVASSSNTADRRGNFLWRAVSGLFGSATTPAPVTTRPATTRQETAPQENTSQENTPPNMAGSVPTPQAPVDVREKVRNREDLHGLSLCDADLSGLDLSGFDLVDADLTGANLRGANLQGANLYHARLFFAILSGADLTAANLQGAGLCNANLAGAKFVRANLSYASLSRANVSRVDFSEANLRRSDLRAAANLVEISSLQRADLSELDLEKCVLRRLDLRGANLTGAFLYSTNLCYAKLQGAKMRGVKMSGLTTRGRTDLTGAKLSGADLSGVNMSEVKMDFADFSHANLSGANLHGAEFNGADFSGATMTGATIWPGPLMTLKRIRLQKWMRGNVKEQLKILATETSFKALPDVIGTIPDDLADKRREMIRAVAPLIAQMTRYQLLGPDDVFQAYLPLLRDPTYVQDHEISESMQQLEVWFSEVTRRSLAHEGDSESVFESLEAWVLRRTAKTLSFAADAMNKAGQGDWLITHHAAINHLMYCMSKKLSESAIQAARGLRRAYAAALPQQLVASFRSDNLVDLRDDDDPDADAFLVFLSDDKNNALFVTYEFYENNFLGRGIPEYWGGMFWYQRQNASEPYHMTPVTAPRETLAGFPRFLRSYMTISHEIHKRLFRTVLPLGNYRESFIAVTEYLKSDTWKYTSYADQAALFSHFKELITSCRADSMEVGCITDGHRRALLLHYSDLLANDDHDLARLLLVISTIMVNISSEYYMGTAGDSPLGIRQYALATLQTACELDATLISKTTMASWRGRLGGFDTGFTCAGTLRGMMRKEIHRRIAEAGDVTLERIFRAIYPPAWI